MSNARFASVVVCLTLASLLLSCQSQPANPVVGQMIDPKITAVSDGGKQAKVNIGEYDGLHVGQRLYVIRGSKFIGMMTVLKATQYESDCAVLTANTDSPAEKVHLANVKVGDLVTRKFQELGKAGQYREKVPRMVPLPYEPQQTPAQAAAEAEINRRVEQAVVEKKIPRELVDAWKKQHPLKVFTQP